VRGGHAGTLKQLYSRGLLDAAVRARCCHTWRVEAGCLDYWEFVCAAPASGHASERSAQRPRQVYSRKQEELLRTCLLALRCGGRGVLSGFLAALAG
jgi:hypothetical protein